MAARTLDIETLLGRIDPDADQVERHLWLHDVLEWIRGDAQDAQASVGRVRQMLAAIGRMPEWPLRWRAWWQQFITHVDATPLLADYGFAPRTAFASELGHRLLRKWLPPTPETTDLSQLFHLLFPQAFDAKWIRALDPATLQHAERLLFAPATQGAPAQDGQPGLWEDSVAEPAVAPPHIVLATTASAWGQPVATYWQNELIEAIAYSVSQISATGFASEIRMRMAEDAETQRAFHSLSHCMDTWTRQLGIHGLQHPETLAATELLREQLAHCRRAAGTVYAHLAEQGVSVGIVFRLRQMRDRVQRVNELLDCLFSQNSAHSTARLVARLIMVGQERRSVRNLIRSSSHLTAAKVAERHAESGETYITRNFREWRIMLGHALGGGFAMGFAVWFKFLIGTLALSIFWGGLVAGINYAVIFVLIQLLHWTIATKQPAVTAPALAARLKAMDQPNAIDAFVDEVSHLIRSQVIAIAGNLLAVVPCVLLIAAALEHGLGQSIIPVKTATSTMASLDVFGTTVLFAGFTGVLLFASSIIAGWTENWFVFHRLDSAIAHHPRFRRLLGVDRARRLAHWMREHVSGLAANISLGLMLGLTPAIALFFGLGLEVRHVTLAAGQLAAAGYTLGGQVLHQQAFWLALAGVALVGPINVIVSFYFAFRTAVAAHNVPRVDRRRINAALRYRLLHAPLSFIFPPKKRKTPSSPTGSGN